MISAMIEVGIISFMTNAPLSKGKGYRLSLIHISYLLELFDYLSDERDKEFVVRCLGVKGFTEAIPKLLTEFKSAKNNYCLLYTSRCV